MHLECIHLFKVHSIIRSKATLELKKRTIHHFKGQCAFRGTSLNTMNLK